MHKGNLETSRHGNGGTLVHLAHTVLKAVAAEVLAQLDAQLPINHVKEANTFVRILGFLLIKGKASSM